MGVCAVHTAATVLFVGSAKNAVRLVLDTARFQTLTFPPDIICVHTAVVSSGSYPLFTADTWGCGRCCLPTTLFRSVSLGGQEQSG